MIDRRASAIGSTDEQVAPFSERTARLLIDSSPIVHYIASACDGFRTTYISRGVRDLLGYEPDQFTQDPAFWVDHVHPDDRSRTMAKLSEILDASRQRLEYRFRHSDGGWRWIHDESVLFRDEGGEPLEIAGAWLDITEQKETEISLARQKAFSESLIETAPTIILLLDSDGRILTINPYMEHLSGYSAAEVVGKEWFSTFLPEEDQSEIRRIFNAVMSAGVNSGHTNRIVVKDGSLRHIEWHAKTLESEDGKCVGLLNIGHDVTERLEYEVALQEARQEAEHANASKSRFLAAASHDLRQPLYALNLFLSTLAEQLVSPDLIDICEKMEVTVDTMAALLDALLDISKLESGSVLPKEQDFPLQTVLDRVMLTNRQQAEERGLHLSCDADDSVVHTDPVLLERILDNLLANAILYTNHGNVSISCSRSRQAVRIKVSDTGVGISRTHLDRIFEEYYQIDNSSRDRRKGLGLGLSIVKRIAQLLDLRLGVTSKPGLGSTFSVEIPLGTNKTEAPQSPRRVKARVRKGHRAQVLLIEDDPVIVDATKMVLRLHGISVLSASNGHEALNRLKDGVRPNVIVSDYRLPGESGIDAIQRVRRALGEDIPAILVTGDTSSVETRSMTLPDCSVLFKPIDSMKLTESIERLISPSL